MASIIIQNMGGLAPRVSPRLLSNGMATTASMVKLWSGEIRPFLELGPVRNAPMPQSDLVKTIYFLVDKWLAWTTDVDVVTGFTTLGGSDRIYYTGDGTPKQTTYTLVKFGPPTPIPSSTYPIGVLPPQDTFTPTVAIAGVAGGDPLVRSYVYTLYSVNGEESVPSPPSQLISVETNQTVNVGNFQNIVTPSPPLPADSYPPNYGNVKELRLYRTFNNEFHFVASIPVPFPAVYNDAVLDQNLGEVLQSQHYFPPPVDIEGLIGLSCGSLAAFHGNKVAFSEPYQPGAWPPEYEKIFDYPVVALGTFGQTCVVATKGFTYLVSGTDPRSFSVARVPDPYPCVSKRSMASADSGCIYSSSDGLIFIGTANYYTQYSGVNVLTRDIATYDEWKNYNPSTILGVIFDGRYYGFYRNPNSFVNTDELGKGFVFDPRLQRLPGMPIEGSAADKDNIFADLDFYASAAFANPQVPLHLVVPFDNDEDDNIISGVSDETPETFINYLFKWEAGPASHPYVWRSKQFSFPYVVTFSAAKITFNPTEPNNLIFRLVDGATGDILFERGVGSSSPFRISSLRPRTEWMVEVEGTSWVEKIHLATSYYDIQEGQANQ